MNWFTIFTQTIWITSTTLILNINENKGKLYGKWIWYPFTYSCMDDLWFINYGFTLIWFTLSNLLWFWQDGGTPLFVACQCNHLDVVEELLSRGADLHAQMIDGATPLFITAQNGHLHLLKYLISRGADVNVKRQVGNRNIRTV